MLNILSFEQFANLKGINGMQNKRMQINLNVNVKVALNFNSYRRQNQEKCLLPNITFILNVLLENGIIFV